MTDKEMFKNLITVLDDLCKRLQDDYNLVKPFDQYEEDRLVIYNVIERLEKIETFVSEQLSTYPVNDTLETIQRYLYGDLEDYDD